MYKRPAALFAAILWSVLCLARQDGGIRSFSAGMLHSPKGMGLTLTAPGVEARKMFSTFSFTADFGGMATGEMTVPGVKFCWFSDQVLAGGSSRDGFDYRLYAGPGLGAGYLRDFDRNGMGVSAMVCGNIGLRLSFLRKMSICFQVETEIGVHYGRQAPGYTLGFYKNGLYRTYVPEVLIMWDF